MKTKQRHTCTLMTCGCRVLGGDPENRPHHFINRSYEGGHDGLSTYLFGLRRAVHDVLCRLHRVLCRHVGFASLCLSYQTYHYSCFDTDPPPTGLFLIKTVHWLTRWYSSLALLSSSRMSMGRGSAMPLVLCGSALSGEPLLACSASCFTILGDSLTETLAQHKHSRTLEVCSFKDGLRLKKKKPVWVTYLTINCAIR